MKKLILISCLFFVMAVGTVFAQDNPLLFGTAGGSNARTYVYNSPYIFGNGSNITVKWKVDLNVAPYQSRRNSFGGIVFDGSGGLYFRSGLNGTGDNGIVKVDAATGTKLWATPLKDTVFSGQPGLVGSQYIYAARYDDANPTVYALDKTTGAVVWESAPLPKKVGLTMALHNGVIYGMTDRDATSGNSFAFAMDAATGAVFHTTPIATTADQTVLNTAFAPDVFGPGEHGLYWFHDNNGTTTPRAEAIYGVSISNAGAGKAWTQTPIRAYGSHTIYNETMNVVYALHWADYGTAVEAYDPVTGAIKWVARGAEMGGSFNGGFYPSHTLKADGSGFIFAGFGGDIWSITDPGDLGGGFLPASQIDWYYNGTDALGESQTLALTIADPLTGQQVFITGTSGNTENPHRLYAMDAITGARLWEWVNPGDVNPSFYAFNFAGLSVGPDGSLYYFDRLEGPQGTLYCLGVIPEPGTIFMIGSGLLGMMVMFRRKK